LNVGDLVSAPLTLRVAAAATVAKADWNLLERQREMALAAPSGYVDLGGWIGGRPNT